MKEKESETEIFLYLLYTSVGFGSGGNIVTVKLTGNRYLAIELYLRFCARRTNADL